MFLGLLTSSLLKNPKNKIIMVDVKGSHSRECKMVGGKEYTLKLDQSSGINPLAIINLANVNPESKILMCSQFLSRLLLDSNEIAFSKTIQSQIEDSISKYIDSQREPSLQDFYEFAVDLPRREFLKRWVPGGVFGQIFANTASDILESDDRTYANRFRYYNFANISEASNPEFAQAGFAALLMQFNYELLRDDGSNIILKCDETKFFFKTCFENLKTSTANIRKHGTVILVSQESQDFIYNGDTGLITNSPQRFFLSGDGDKSKFKERFDLKEEAVEETYALQSLPGKYSEIMHQDPYGTRKLVLKISPEEYWRFTTSKKDNDKLKELMGAVPWISLRQAIHCLSLESHATH